MVNQRLAFLVMVVTALSLPAYADKGKDAYHHGVEAQRKQDFDSAYAYFKQAYTLVPKNAAYLAAYTRMRFESATRHVRAGQLLYNTGALTQALVEFQRAAEIDASNFYAQQELRRTADTLRQQERQKTVPKIESPLAKFAAEAGESVELRPLSNAAITLRMTANADVAYKTICKLAGINVLIDPDYRPQKMTVDLTDVTLREALDMVRLQSKTFWRPVSKNTIFVTMDSPAKRKELEQNVMKTFYLKNVATPADLQEAANVVRQILDVSRVQLLQGQDAMILRGTMDQMVLAEKLLADIDKPKSEVVIDVVVMQVSRNQVRTLGTTVPTSVTAGYLGPGSSGTSGSGSSGSGTYMLHLGTFAVSIPGGSFTALASDSHTKILQNPEIRALNDEKATLRIGDRVPIATGSFQTSVIGAGGINTQFQYLDVGVNIDITPHIHAEGEVTLKMSLEISSLNGQETIGGITQPIIGQRRIDLETRLADGEVNLLGGILEDSETQSMSGYPWISKLPLLKYLFAQDNKNRTENEIVFAITPHIVRGREVTEENQRVMDVGTGTTIELRRKPAAAPTATAENVAAPGKPQQGVPQAPPPGAPGSGSSLPGTPPQASPQTKPVTSQ